MISPAWRLFWVSFLALFLETAFIRWSPSQVNILAFFANLILISSFLGLGIGTCGLVKDRAGRPLPGLALLLVSVWGIGAFLQGRIPAEAFGAGAAALLAAGGYRLWKGRGASRRWAWVLAALVPLVLAAFLLRRFTAHYFIWGMKDWRTVALALAAFALNAAFFVEMGLEIGAGFVRVPARRAYGVNLLGSLGGVLLQWGLSALEVPPILWFAAAFAVLWLVVSERPLVRAASLGGMVLVAWAGWSPPGTEIWSPYYRIQLREDPGEGFLNLNVNTDYITRVTLRPTPPPPAGMTPRERAAFNAPRHVPFAFSPPRSVLVLGAGGGVDVTAALAEGAVAVDAVEIDPAIQRIAETRNADRPYDDPRARAHVTDARAFVRTAPSGHYSHVVYSFLDSQRIMGWLSNIRLDNYVYTVESLRDAARLLDPSDGVLALYFAVNRDWIGKKLYAMVKQATGQDPLVLSGEGNNRIFLAGPGVRGKPEVARELQAALPGAPEEFADPADVGIPTDDWPQLYYRSRSLTPAYLVALAAILAGTAWTLRRFLGGPSFALFFFLGGGFLLVETWALTRCGLLFGSTWLVNPIVLTAVFVVSLAAVYVPLRLPAAARWTGLFGGLALCLLLPRGLLLDLPMALRVPAAGALFGLPLFFAGMIFADALSSSADPRRAFGANLLGAVLGGVLEFASLVVGTQGVALVAVALYALAALSSARSKAA